MIRLCLECRTSAINYLKVTQQFTRQVTEHVVTKICTECAAKLKFEMQLYILPYTIHMHNDTGVNDSYSFQMYSNARLMIEGKYMIVPYICLDTSRFLMNSIGALM